MSVLLIAAPRKCIDATLLLLLVEFLSRMTKALLTSAAPNEWAIA
jgi:hypothetical protein